MGSLVKFKRKEKKEQAEQHQVTEEELEGLQKKLKEVENHKLSEERKLKHEIAKQESKMKSLNHEYELVNLQVKEKDQECRLNELKIKELKRQLPPRILKQLEEKEKELRAQFEQEATEAQAERAEVANN